MHGISIRYHHKSNDYENTGKHRQNQKINKNVREESIESN